MTAEEHPNVQMLKEVGLIPDWTEPLGPRPPSSWIREEATTEELDALMGACPVSPAEPDICLACYAYEVVLGKVAEGAAEKIEIGVSPGEEKDNLLRRILEMRVIDLLMEMKEANLEQMTLDAGVFRLTLSRTYEEDDDEDRA